MSATMNISLPETQAEFVRECVKSEGFQTVSEYFRALVREDQKRKADVQIEALLTEGIGSPRREMTEDDWASLRARIERYRQEKRT